MKKCLIIFSLSATFAIPQAQAGCDQFEAGDPCISFFKCAPEVVEGNLKATDRILVDLAAHPPVCKCGEIQILPNQTQGDEFNQQNPDL